MNDRQNHSRSRWFRISLRGLMLFVTICCILFAQVALRLYSAWRQQLAVAEIQLAGGGVEYTYLMRTPESEAMSPPQAPWVPRRLRDQFGPDYFEAVQTVYFGDPNPNDLPPITDDALKSLRRFPELRQVCFWSTDAGDESLIYLENIPKLQYLTLWRNRNITDEGMKSIQRLGQLRFLEIYGRQITDEGIKHLGRMQSLEQLRLFGANVTDQGLEHLRSLTSLRELILERATVTPEGIERLQTALPDCRIVVQ